MKKVVGQIGEIIKGIVFIGFSIQIILGVIWMCFNFTHLQYFSIEGGALYGLLYDWAIKLYPLVYLIQLVVSFAVGFFVAGELFQEKKIWSVWMSLAMMTFPMSMQCHLAVTPYSLTGSLLLLELTFAICSLRRDDEKYAGMFAGMGVCWLLMMLLLPEYIVLGCIPIVVVLLCIVLRHRKEVRKIIPVILLTAAFSGLIGGTESLITQESYLSKENVIFHLFERAVWPTLWNDSVYWPEEVRNLTEETLREYTYKAENPERMMKPVMRENFTQDVRLFYYDQMLRYSWTVHKSMIVRQTAWDALGYTFPGMIVPLQLKGVGYDSYSGRNYEMMIQQAPALSGFYMAYGCWWFVVSLVSVVILVLIRLLKNGADKRKLYRGKICSVLVCVITAGAVVLLYTLRGAGMMDYKCTFTVVTLWFMICFGMARKEA